MSLRTSIILSFVLVIAGVALIGCSLTDPEETSNQTTNSNFTFDKTASSTTLVPNWDITNTGWVGYPDAMDSLYRFIDEGVPNQPGGDFIYTWINGATYRCAFTDMDTTTALDISAIEISTVGYMGAGDALRMQMTMSIYINNQLVDSQMWECGEMPNIACNGLDFSTTFDGLCFDASDINTLELEIEVSGTWWDQGHSNGQFNVIDAIIHYDNTCDPDIQDLEVNRKGNNFAIVWDTPCDATSKVIWGYDPGALTNSVTGGASTHHIINFTAADTEGCVYLKAIANSATCSALADTSALQTSVKDIVISNINRSIDPVACTMTVTWDTNVKSSSKLYWGGTCSTLTNVGTGAGNTTSHSVTVDISGTRANSRIYSKPESETGCDSAQGACNFIFRFYCIG